MKSDFSDIINTLKPLLKLDDDSMFMCLMNYEKAREFEREEMLMKYIRNNFNQLVKKYPFGNPF